MNLAIRPADLERDRAAMLALLVEHFVEWDDERKFDWLYRESPMGQPRTWLLERGDEIVGISSAFPRRLRVGGRSLSAFVLGDFCVSREYRSLGPAMALQRAACEAVDRGDADLWYDFPSRTMSGIYGRIGLRTHGELVRLVYPLRVDRAVEKKLPAGFLAAGLREVGNKVLSSRDAARRRDPSVEIEARDRDFESGVESGVEDRGVSLERTARYLNWRYRRDPRGAFPILSASRDGERRGFLVFRRVGDDFMILDAFGSCDDGIVRELVLAGIEIARREDALSVSVGISGPHPWKAVFEEIGFHARDAAPFVVYARPGVLDSETPWFLMSGDRD